MLCDRAINALRSNNSVSAYEDMKGVLDRLHSLKDDLDSETEFAVLRPACFRGSKDVKIPTQEALDAWVKSLEEIRKETKWPS